MTKKLTISVVLLLITATAMMAQAVAGLGGLTGTVRDASGAIVPGASVVISNESKGIRRSVQSNDAGVFNAPALAPADGYKVAVTKSGFGAWEAKSVELLVGQTINLNVVLQVATTSTAVEISASAPLVEETKTGVSQVVEKDQIDNLPINGRRADTFVLLTPAVTNDGEFGLVSFRGVAMGNTFLTDGNDTTQAFYGENAGRTRISTQISQDAVQEFQVLSNGFSAEFGRAMGGIINTVTRSGSNGVHGTAYWFFRNQDFNAFDRYQPAIPMAESRHQAGASLGGPIKKDKLFYFGNFEIVKRDFPGLNRIINAPLTGDGTRVTATCTTATAAQCAAATAFIQKQMNVVVPREVSSLMGFAKIDWRPSDRNSFSFSSNAMHWRSPHGIQTQAVLNAGNMLAGNANSTVETRYGKASWTSIPTNSSVNEFRFGWFKDRLSDPAASDLYPSTGPLYISVNGSEVGGPKAYPRTLPSEQRFSFADNISWTVGKHSTKFGFDTSTNQDYVDQLYNAFGGYSYSTLNQFALDFTGNTLQGKNYSNFTQAFGNPIQNFRTTDFAFFGQDVWKATKKLTLNYGVRYEKTRLPQPWITNTDYPATGRIPSPNNNIAPRFSASYAFNEKTVLRAGYGIFWARFHTNGIDTLLLGNGLFQPNIYVTPTTAGAPIFPNIFAGMGSIPANTVNLQYAAADFHNPYTQQGNISLERELTRDLGLTVSYIWSRGIGIWTQRDMNLAAPSRTVTYTILDAAGNTTGAYTTPVYTAKADTRYGKILQVENGGQSWYNGLAVQLRKRMSHGITGSFAYTWSHAIDDANMQGASWNVGWNYNNVTTPGDYRADKGSSSLDQRHRAVINWLWEPKIAPSKSLLGSRVLNGFQLSAITTLASSHPNTATVNVSGTQFTGVYLANNTSLNGSGGWSRVPFLPVSSLDVDRIYRVDARLTRVFAIKERMKLSASWEAFNVFNTITNTSINTQAYTASSGKLTPNALVGTGTASQGFPDGSNARRMQMALRFVF